MTTSTKPVEAVPTFTQSEIDAHLAEIVAAATKRNERAPRRPRSAPIKRKRTWAHLAKERPNSMGISMLAEQERLLTLN